MFKSPSQEFVYVRTYSRWIEELKRRETWEETVDRYINFIKEERGDLIPKKVIRKMRKYILNLEVMPSMRALWAAGEAARRDNTCMYNCAFQSVDSIHSFSECLYVLMCGTGYGFSVESKYTDKLPVVKNMDGSGAGVYVISDDKKGWADSLKILMEQLYEGRDLEFDYSSIRKKGSKLEVMGGRASGPEPLITLHNYVRESFSTAQGRKLTSLECHDIMCQIAEIVVVGGVRRSSEISLSDLDNKEMRDAKTGTFPLRRYMANNSAVYVVKPSAVDFLNEWASLANSGSGERGIFNLEAVKENTPKRRDSSLILGTNPCFTGDTELLTSEGYMSFKDLCNKEVELVNWVGEVHSGKVWSNGVKDIVTVRNSLGELIRCTPDHRFMLNDGEESEARNLRRKRLMPLLEVNNKNDHFTKLGFIQGDGSLTRLGSKTHKGLEVHIGNNDQEIGLLFGLKTTLDQRSYYINGFNEELKELGFQSKVLPERGMPSTFDDWEVGNKLSFLRGMYSANGSVIKKKRVAFKTTCYDLACSLVDELSCFEIKSYITTNKKKKVEFSNGVYECKESYDINIASYNSIKKFAKLIGFVHEYKTADLKLLLVTKSPMITSVRVSGREEVFDFNLEDDTHWGVVGEGYVAHNCGEVCLRSMEFCNLSEVVVKESDDLDDLMKKVECATWIGAIQSTFTKFPYLRRKWKINCEEERLLGVSLTGQMDNPKMMTKDNLTALKKKAIKVASRAAKILGVNMSTSITLGKPSGSVSQLVDAASGCHVRYSPFYVRRYRISATDPLLAMLVDQGIPMSPEVGQRECDMKKWSEKKVDTWVVEFPTASPKNSMTRHDVNAIQQLEHYKLIQDNWCEHNQSCTIYVKDDEWFDVGNWVYKNWSSINGVSFLPYDGGKYELAPYEEIEEETYKKLFKEFPEIDYSQLSRFELEDNTEGAKSYSCVGDLCELK